MIKREIALFAVVGSLTVLLDFVIYRGLFSAELLDMDWAKAVGFLTGTVFAYFANQYWTFGHKQHGAGKAWRFILLYFITCVANVLVNTVALLLLSPSLFAVQWAFFLATGVSACLNFLGMKLFVFHTPRTIKELG